MKLKIFLVASSLIAMCQAATVNLVKRASAVSASEYQNIRDRNEDLFKDDNFVFGAQIKDNKEPTIYTGDVMKAKTLQNLNRNTKTKGKFGYALGTENGIEIEQLGKLKADNKTLVVTGSYSYTGANGKRYRVRYTADEFGYHPKTELIIDLPELDGNAGAGAKPTSKPFSFSGYDKMRELLNKSKGGNGDGNGDGNGNKNGNGDGYGKDKPAFGLGDPSKSTNANRQSVEDRKYLPPITDAEKKVVEDRKYLPPNDYLPPVEDVNLEYLPPTK